MAVITVQTNVQDGGWVFEVEVVEGGSRTSHTVVMTKDAYQRLTGGACPPEECVRHSFEFLLEREPKESILRKFDITRIGYYFPEYERELLNIIQKASARFRYSASVIRRCGSSS
jgi:phosphatidylethanolamine-binding protein (PEBP) family uncharacterized protein